MQPFNARYNDALAWAVERAKQVPGVRFTAQIDAFRLTCWTTRDGRVRYETRLDLEEAK